MLFIKLNWSRDDPGHDPDNLSLALPQQDGLANFDKLRLVFKFEQH